MAHHDLRHETERKQQAPSLFGENSYCDRRKDSRFDDQHDSRGVAVEENSAENSLDRIDYIEFTRMHKRTHHEANRPKPSHDREDPNIERPPPCQLLLLFFHRGHGGYHSRARPIKSR